MKYSSLVLATLMLSVSCSKVKELDDRTKNLDQNTQKMSSTTNDMSRKMDETNQNTGNMYQQLRLKEAEETRDRKFEILMDDKADIGTRITAAGVFYKSMEFQLYSDNGTFDNKDHLQSLYLDAANEFTRRLCDLYAKIDVNKMDPSKKGSRHADEMSFYALATALHENNFYQEALTKGKSSEPFSMYDMIKKALKKDFQGKVLEKHEEILVNGINRQMMIDLFKARVDMISALALNNLTTQRGEAIDPQNNKVDKNFSLTKKAQAAIFKITGGRFGKIELPSLIDESNNATKNQTATYLDAALKTKNFLAEINVKTKVQKTISSGLSHVEFEKAGTAQEERIKDPKKEEIKSLIGDLLK